MITAQCEPAVEVHAKRAQYDGTLLFTVLFEQQVDTQVYLGPVSNFWKSI